MRQAHANLLLRSGTLRVGTLREYRRTETYGDQVGDPNEGYVAHIESIDDLVVGETGELSQFSKQGITVRHGASLKNISVIKGNESPDLYIYSMSSAFDRESMRAFGYDACIRIVRPDEFLKALSHTLRHHATFEGIFPCVYGSRFLPPSDTHLAHPALLKPQIYAHQQEVRAVWRPLGANPRPRIVSSRKTSRHCIREA